MQQVYLVVKPESRYLEYWPEMAFLGLGAAIPTVFLWHFGASDWLERSGSLAVFCAAVAEFIALNRLTRKHFNNAARVRVGEAPWITTTAFQVVGWAAFMVGLVGTVIWGFGSKL